MNKPKTRPAIGATVTLTAPCVLQGATGKVTRHLGTGAVEFRDQQGRYIACHARDVKEVTSCPTIQTSPDRTADAALSDTPKT